VEKMGLFDKLIGRRIPDGELREIGYLEPLCPYCYARLDSIPIRSNPCPECGNTIFVGIRPLDDSKILLREDQIEELEEQWAIKKGVYQEYLGKKEMNRVEYEEEQSFLRKRFTRTPSRFEIQWELLWKKCLKHARNFNWRLYRDVRLEMAELLKKERKLNRALEYYYELCYLDLNGPVDTGGGYSTSFDPETGLLSPGVIEQIKEINILLPSSKEKHRILFLEYAKNIRDALKLPVYPEEAWKKVEKQVFES
jgi:hypothetical protein